MVKSKKNYRPPKYGISPKYSHSSMVDEAMNNRPHSIDGRQVQPKRAVPRDDFNHPGSNMSVNKIFVGGLRDKPIEKEDLDAYFGTFGSVREVLISTDKETGKSRGFGFVLFDDVDSVDKVVLQRSVTQNTIILLLSYTNALSLSYTTSVSH